MNRETRRGEGMLSKRVLVLKAGSGHSNNVIRSLKAGDPSLEIVGCHDDRFVLKKSLADRNCVVPANKAEFPAALRRIIEGERTDLLVPVSDADVLAISKLRKNLPCQVFLPRDSVIARCQDKYVLTSFLRARRIPAPLTCPITRLEQVEGIFRRLKPFTRLWCRVRSGTGSFAAIPVKSPAQARSWIRYWEEMRGVRPGSFTLSEYLPGRDFCVQSLWKDGRLILTKMAERITYIDTASPSGVSSTPALARTAFEPAAIAACARAVRALDRKASGVYMIDIKENEAREPCITEINAGRFAGITNIHDMTGRHNMAAIYVRLALGEPVELHAATDYAQGYFLVRSVDTQPAIMRLGNLFENVVEWKETPA